MAGQAVDVLRELHGITAYVKITLLYSKGVRSRFLRREKLAEGVMVKDHKKKKKEERVLKQLRSKFSDCPDSS